MNQTKFGVVRVCRESVPKEKSKEESESRSKITHCWCQSRRTIFDSCVSQHQIYTSEQWHHHHH